MPDENEEDIDNFNEAPQIQDPSQKKYVKKAQSKDNKSKSRQSAQEEQKVSEKDKEKDKEPIKNSLFSFNILNDEGADHPMSSAN